MTTPARSLSVVVPVFNSEATIDELHDRIVATLRQVPAPAEVIYVDDGSRDGVWRRLEQLAAGCSMARAIRLSRNFGQTSAVLCGLAHARGDLAVTIDDDLQNAPEDILKLYQRMCADNHLDVLFATPANRKQHNLIRTAASHLLGYIDRVSSGSSYRGFTSSFRILRRSVVDAILSQRLPRPAIAPMIFAASRFIDSQPVVHYPRKAGRSGYTGLRLIRLGITRLLMSTSFPLKALAYAGCLGLLLCILAGTVVLVKYMLGEIRQPGWTTLVLLQVTGISLNFIGFGLLGEYLHRVLGTVQNSPQYVIRTTVNGHSNPEPTTADSWERARSKRAG